MALTRYGNLQFKYNSWVNTEMKSYLPINGNKIPGKLIKNFDDLTEITFENISGSTDNGLEKTKAYKSTACRKGTTADSGAYTIIYTPAAAIDLTSLSVATNNNYAKVKQTGKYKTGGTSYKDTLFLALNMAHYYSASVGIFTGSFTLKIWSGTQLAFTTAGNKISLADKTAYYRDTYQIPMDTTHFTYQCGFTGASWEAITKIEIILYGGSGADINTYFYLHNLNIALPKYSATVTDAYYPAITDSNSKFVSHLFGEDTAAGGRTTPVKTIEKALALIAAASAGYLNVVIMDSEIYKPIALDYTYAGIQQTLDRHTTIIADYLETPKISCEPGLLNADRIGSRKNYRTAFYNPPGGPGNTFTVGEGGTYATINSAHNAASAGDCIEIIDSATYDELLTADKVITIQARAGFLPKWKKTGGATCLNANGFAVNVYGIEFIGNETASEIKIISSLALGAVAEIKDCTFRNIGTSTGTATAIRENGITTGVLTIENCLFIENGENFIAIERPSATAGTVKIINCIGYMGTTTNNYFVKAGKATASYLSTTISNGNKVIAGSNTALSWFYYVADVAGAASATYFYAFMNDFNNRVTLDSRNSLWIENRFISNYIHDNEQTSNTIFYFTTLYTVGRSQNNVFKGNVFYNLTAGSGSIAGILKFGELGVIITQNIFIKITGCSCIFTYADTATPFSVLSNIFIACTRGCYVESYDVTNITNIDKCVFIDCTNSVYARLPAATAVITNTVYYNSPTAALNSGTVIISTGNSTVNPNLIDPVNLNLGWYFDSVLETQNYYREWLSKFIYPAGAFDFNLKFLDLEGFAGQTIDTAAAHVKPQYCYIHDFTVGLSSTLGQVSPLNCLIENNGIGIRYNNATINTMPDCKYNIINKNNTGILLRSGVAIEYCSIVNGDYGITALISGYYSLLEYMGAYLTIKNSIIFDNEIYDYYYNLPTSYCLIGTRYFDALPDSDINYAVTIGVGDVSENPQLDANYFPGLKITGYKKDSPAWKAASTATQNIGARYLNKIKAEFAFTEYTINSNPQEMDVSIIPVNLESVIDISGNYEADFDVEITKVAFSWGEPGRLSKIMETQKQVMKYIYATYWVVGISTDGGVTFKYYKVNKDAAPNYGQIGFYYSELPVGEWIMEFYEMPAAFDIANYTINNMEA